MGGDGLTHHGAKAGHQVEHARRKSSGMNGLGQDERIERRHFTRLQHHGATGRHRRRHLEGNLVERVVPRGDATNHTNGLAHHDGIADLLLEHEVFGHLRVVTEFAYGQAGLDHLGHTQRHTHFPGDHLGQFVHPGGQRALDGQEVVGPVGGRCQRPAVEGAPGRSDGGIHILGGAQWNMAHDLLGGGVEHVDGVGAGGRDPGPVDVQLIVIAHPRSVPPPAGLRQSGHSGVHNDDVEAQSGEVSPVRRVERERVGLSRAAPESMLVLRGQDDDA